MGKMIMIVLQDYKKYEHVSDNMKSFESYNMMPEVILETPVLIPHLCLVSN